MSTEWGESDGRQQHKPGSHDITQSKHERQPPKALFLSYPIFPLFHIVMELSLDPSFNQSCCSFQERDRREHTREREEDDTSADSNRL